MKNIFELEKQLKEHITNLLIPLQTQKKIDRKAFELLKQSAMQLANVLKGSDLVSKKLLNELFTTCKVLSLESSYMGDYSNEVKHMSEQLQFIFELILKDESSGDRVPGIPRII